MFVVVVGFCGLAPLQGAEASIVAKGYSFKDGNVGVGWRKQGNVLDHPQGHLVSDHVATFGYSLIVPEHAFNDVDGICFREVW